MATSLSHSNHELLADEYTNGDACINTEKEKTHENNDDIVTDTITINSENKLSSKGKKAKGKKNKDFDLDFDVEDELNRIEQETTELKLKPKTDKRKQDTNKTEIEDLPTEVLEDVNNDESTVKSKSQKKRDKNKKKKQTTQLEDGAEPQNEEAKESAEPSLESETSSKKKKKPGQKGPSSGMREQIRKALKEQEETDRLKKEEEERKALEFEMREQERLARVEKERLRKEKKKTQRRERIAEQKLAGTFLTKEQKDKIKERQEKAATMQQAYGMTVGPNTEDDGVVKVKYGGRKRNKNKDMREDGMELSVNGDDGSVDVKEGSPVESEPVRDSWEDLVPYQTADCSNKQLIKDNWEDTDPSDTSSSDDSSHEAETIEVIAPTTTTTTTTTTEQQIESTLNNATEPGTDTKHSDGSHSSDSDSDASPYDRIKERILKRRAKAERDRTTDKLRSPILCVLGHVDTGKTKILDKIRHTSVQDGEAGGITQQIGATFVPSDVIRTQTSSLKEFSQKTEILIPGLLIIDTPGHESFRNLRSRGSSLCDIAILVVDIMHGLEPQTIESINLLKKKKCKFIIALNKVDRIYDWRRNPHVSVKDNLKKQKRNTADHFNERLSEVKLELNTQGLNVALFWEKFNFDEYIPMVPTSAITGDGMGDLMAMMVLMCQKFIVNRLMWSREVEATVLEVKVTPGYGHTLDVVIKNGTMKEGDTLVLFGTEGPIVTQARAILTPQPLREMRVKGEFIHHQLIDNSQGIKIAGKELENAVASSPILVPARPDEVPVLVDEISAEMKAALTDFKLKDKGIYVQASTLGSMEALLEFLKSSKIPYCGINIGPVYRKDVIRCSTMLEHDPQYAIILAFDVRIDKDAQELSDQLGIKIFTADIIYHLFDNYTAHVKNYAQKMKDEHRHLAVYPVRMTIVPNCVFNTRDPLVMGVRVEEGVLTNGTPIYVPGKHVDIGIVTSLEINHKPVEKTRKGVEVCVKIETPPGEAPKMFDRHFGYEDELVSKITRGSIDVMKKYFKEELVREDWELMVQLKKIFGIF